MPSWSASAQSSKDAMHVCTPSMCVYVCVCVCVCARALPMHMRVLACLCFCRWWCG